MDKYKKLFSNTIVFAIGTFSSKILTILLTPFITRALNTGEYGVMDIVQQTVNVLVPLATLAVNSAALRFAMDKAEDKRAVFSTGVMTTGIGFGVFLCFTPLFADLTINKVNIGEYVILIAVFLLSSSTRQLCQQFVRGMGWVRLYAMDGIVATFTNLICTVLFLGVFDWGINGAIMAIATSDFLSIILLTAFGRLDRFIRPKRLNWRVSKAMLRYAIPLVPTAILWLIINVANRYMITYYLDASANGLYAAATKIPNFVMLFAGIFVDAWQLSAVDEYDNAHKARFFTKIFKIYSGSLFAVGAGLILFCQLFTKILVAPSYYESWKYVPILIISTIFSCLVNFLASVYMAEKKNSMSMFTALAGAVISVVLNLVLIPKIGINGAALATLSSFLLVFILRAMDTRRFVHIGFSVVQMGLSMILLSAQAVLMIYWDQIGSSQVLLYGVEVALTLAVLALNGKPLVEILVLLGGKFLHKKLPAKQAATTRHEQTTEDDLGKNELQAPTKSQLDAPRNFGLDKPISPRSRREGTPNQTEDYWGLGIDLDQLLGQPAITDLSEPEPPHQISYQDDFAGEYKNEFSPPEKPSFRTGPTHSKNALYDNKVTEYTDAEDASYFDEENTGGFIPKKNGNIRRSHHHFDE